MSVTRKYLPCNSVLLTLIYCVSSAQCLQFTDDDRQLVADAIQSYFPVEKTLCVVPAESDDEAFLPPFHVPVVVFSQDQLLEGCGEQIKYQDGYVLITSTYANLEGRIVPLLKCVNETTLKLKTKYILVLDLSKDSQLNRDKNYSFFSTSPECFWNHQCCGSSCERSEKSKL